jgi:type II secretory pathway pseudopilin PulG
MSSNFVRRFQKSKRGITLFEVLIASSILAMVSVTVLSTMTFSNKSTRLNTNAVMAKNIAQGYFEKMNSDFFAEVHPGNPDYTDITKNSADPVYLDEYLDMKCAIDFDFRGFGIAEGATVNSLTDSSKIPGMGDWETDEWKGHNLYLVDGDGLGQHAEITGNTADTLSYIGNAFAKQPAAGTKYMIDNGKTVRITTNWEYMGKSYDETIGSLIINYRNEADQGLADAFGDEDN